MEFKNRFSRKDLLSSLDEFSRLYSNRPIKENSGGMKSAHMFPAWFIIKKTKPKYIIESGVFQGLGTWFFEQASPESKIICIEPEQRHIIYRSEKASYQTKDFLLTDWSHLPKEETFLFLDDHQNFIERLKGALSMGFKKMTVEDNYPAQQGDCYSPKKILANTDYVIDRAGSRSWFPNKKEDLSFFREHVSVYQEMPPIFKGSHTRWGDPWTDSNYPTPPPLLTSPEDAEKYPTFAQEYPDYTWICYIELN